MEHLEGEEAENKKRSSSNPPPLRPDLPTFDTALLNSRSPQPTRNAPKREGAPPLLPVFSPILSRKISNKINIVQSTDTMPPQISEPPSLPTIIPPPVSDPPPTVVPPPESNPPSLPTIVPPSVSDPPSLPTVVSPPVSDPPSLPTIVPPPKSDPPSLPTSMPPPRQKTSPNVLVPQTENSKRVLNRKVSHSSGLATFAELPKEPKVDLSTIKASDIMTEEQFINVLGHKHVSLDLTKWSDKRNRIAYEIYTTEETYVKGLHIALIVYRNPIKAAFELGILDHSFYPLIQLFEVMNMIENINYTLMLALRRRFETWSEEQLLGDIICTLTPFLKMYRQYTQIYDNAILSISAPKNSNWKPIIDKANNHPLTNKNPIGSFLILPVQRVPRYGLLLRDLLSKTPETHPDYQNLTDSLELMKTVTFDINDAIKQAESSTKCLEVLHCFIDPPELSKVGSEGMIPKYIKHGIILKQCRKARKNRVLVLFAKALVYADTIPAMPGQWKLSFVVDVSNVSCESVADQPKQNILNAINILTKIKSFRIFLDNKHDKDSWLEAFRSVGLLDKPYDYAPVWIPDDAVTFCGSCDAEFGILRRKHHCRNCGNIVCGNCSQNKIKVIGSEYPERVCDYCFKQITKKKTAVDSSDEE